MWFCNTRNLLMLKKTATKCLRPIFFYLIRYFSCLFIPQVAAAGGNLKFTVSYDITEEEEEETARLMVQSVIIEVKYSPPKKERKKNKRKKNKGKKDKERKRKWPAFSDVW